MEAAREFTVGRGGIIIRKCKINFLIVYMIVYKIVQISQAAEQFIMIFLIYVSKKVTKALTICGGCEGVHCGKRGYNN